MALTVVPLTSSAIQSISYDPDDDEAGMGVTVTVDFERGSYDFDGVPLDLVEQWIKSSSPGGFFHTYIKGSYG